MKFKMAKHFSQGFTLIELMIAVAILGILVTVAAPQYQDYLRKTGRSDAYKALGRMADQQEHYVLRNNAASYAADAALVGGTDTEFGYYKISVASADAKGFVLQADVVPGSAQDGDTGCMTLTLSSTGVKTPIQCWPQ